MSTWKDQIVPGRTMIGISGSILTPRFQSRSFQELFGPSRYSIESSICDNLKHQKRCSEVPFFLECIGQSQKLSPSAGHQSIAGDLLGRLHISLRGPLLCTKSTVATCSALALVTPVSISANDNRGGPLMRFLYQFVSKKTPNSAMMSQKASVLIG